jgi:hypothetical protein
MRFRSSMPDVLDQVQPAPEEMSFTSHALAQAPGARTVFMTRRAMASASL